MKQREKLEEKWAQTGWRLEQKYGNKVLVGNWAEERLQFTREPKTAESTNRADYRPHWDFKPDVSRRGYALLRAEGLPSKQLFGHCRPASSHYLVTQYGDSYGREHTNTLPALQPGSPGGSTWQPDRSDQPIPDLPTDFGFPWSARRRLEKQQSHLPSMTVYRSAYQSHPLSAFCQGRFARASRALQPPPRSQSRQQGPGSEAPLAAAGPRSSFESTSAVTTDTETELLNYLTCWLII